MFVNHCPLTLPASLRIILASLVLTLATASAAAQTAPLKKLQELTHKGARVSALVIDLDHKRVLSELEPDLRLTPASVSKLFITAAALEQWGPDSVFTTRFSSGAQIKDGVLGGDLMLVGAGDPDLDSERLWLLITRLRQAGVRTISGDLIINDYLFGPVICLITDRCEARNVSDNAYDAPLSAAGVNFSSIELSILPSDTPGEPASLQLLPPTLAGVTIDGTIETVARNAAASYAVRRVTKFGEHTLHVKGQVPAGAGAIHVQRSVAYPSRYTGSILARMLADSGISVEGITRVDSNPPPEDFRTVAEVQSPALAQQLRKMMAYSNNYMADTLTLNMLAYSDVPGPLTLPLAAQRLEAFATNVNAREYAWDNRKENKETPLILDSGSGLSVTNRLSARDVVSLLAYMYRQNANFPAFLGSLPVPLHAPSRSLKSGNIQWLTRVAVKTGSLSEPISVRALAGYIRLETGGWGAFAVIVNGSKAKRRIPFYTANGAIIADIESILARY